MKKHPAITRTQQWLTDAVIAYQFCPYAKQPHERNLIGYHVYEDNQTASLLEQIAMCCIALDNARDAVTGADFSDENTLETTLFIIANSAGEVEYLSDFYNYLDALALVDDFLEAPQRFVAHFSDTFRAQFSDKVPKTWEEKYQIASFHPDYQFDGTMTNGSENFTNRSPYPIFHLIRNASIEHVRMNDKYAEHIVAHNIAMIEGLSTEAFALLKKLAGH